MAVNPYRDENGVPLNHWQLPNQQELDLIEYALTSRRMAEILTEGVLAHWQSYDLAHLQAIHRHLFQDVYDWAGKIRTVHLNKYMANGQVSVFAPPERIVPAWEKLTVTITQFSQQHDLSCAEKVRKLTEIFIKANYLHPFPEGNGRSLQILMQQLAKEQGVWLDYQETQAKSWNYACALSGVYGDMIDDESGRRLVRYPTNREPIIQIFQQIAKSII